MIHATYITYTSSKKEATLRLPQLVVRFLADSNRWNVNRTLNLKTARQMLEQNETAGFWQCSCTT